MVPDGGMGTHAARRPEEISRVTAPVFYAVVVTAVALSMSAASAKIVCEKARTLGTERPPSDRGTRTVRLRAEYPPPGQATIIPNRHVFICTLNNFFLHAAYRLGAFPATGSRKFRRIPARRAADRRQSGQNYFCRRISGPGEVQVLARGTPKVDG